MSLSVSTFTDKIRTQKSIAKSSFVEKRKINGLGIVIIFFFFASRFKESLASIRNPMEKRFPAYSQVKKFAKDAISLDI